jgi:hypothetical protein
MKRITLVFLLFAALCGNAQFSEDILSIKFQTFQTENLNGSLATPYQITMNEATTVNINNIEYFLVNNEGVSVDENSLIEGSYVGSSVDIETLYINYNSENTPFYLLRFIGLTYYSSCGLRQLWQSRF